MGVKLKGMTISLLVAAAVPVPALAASEVKLPQLDIATYASQIFWLVVTFVVLYFLVSRIAVPRISNVLEERQDRIADDLDRAERLKNDAEQVRAEYEKALRDARDRAHSLMRTVQEAATADAVEAEGRSRERVNGMLREAEHRIAAAKTEAVGNIRAVSTAVAIDAVDRLVGLKVPEARVGEVVETIMTGRDQ